MITKQPRRAFLRSIAALPIVAAPIAATAYAANFETDPDAELIALGMQFEAAWTHQKSLENEEDISGDALDAAIVASGAIVARIEKLTAITLAGAKVKAKAILWCACGEEIGDDYFNDGCTTDVRLAAGLVRDLLV